MKKNNIIKILTIIVITVILIWIIIFGAFTIKKMVIISDLSNKSKKFLNSKNFHQTTYSYFRDSFSRTDIFYLDGKFKSVAFSIIDGKTKKTTYFAEESMNSSTKVLNYIEYDGEKIAKYVDSRTYLPSSVLYNSFPTENLFELFKFSVKTNLKEISVMGKELYYVDKYNGDSSAIVCFDKNTGLEYGYSVPDSYKTTTLEFDTVTEADFVEPNISEYTMQ